MGREVRRVPAEWQHPKDGQGRHIPLRDGYQARVDQWDRERAKWDEGLTYNYGRERTGELEWEPKSEHALKAESFEDWDGERPRAEEYMPDWPAEERTHLQMYENTSEGTPISPVMDTPERLSHWLADNGASAFGSETASYEAWLRVCRGGYAPSAVVEGGVLRSGVEALRHSKA